MLLAGAVIVLLRLEDADRSLIWAEDGRDFLATAYTGGLGSTLLQPFAGYAHVVPRLASEFVAGFAPIDAVGYWINTAGALVWSTAAVVAFVFTRGRLRLPLRVLAWLFVLIVPIGSMEVATNIANAHWFLDFALLMVLFSRSGGVGRIVFGSIVAAAAALSDPLTVLALPLVLARAVVLPRKREQVVSVAFVVALAVQLAVVESTTREQQPGLFPLGLSKLYVLRVVWQTFAGPATGTVIQKATGLVLPVIVGLLIVLALVAVILRHRRRAGFAAVTLAGSIAFTGLVAVLTWKAVSVPAIGQEIYWGSRYWVVPSLLLIMSVLGAIDAVRPDGARMRRGAAIASAVVVAVLLVSSASNFRTPDYKVGPDTADRAQELEEFCRADPTAIGSLEIAPTPWTMKVPCSTVNER